MGTKHPADAQQLLMDARSDGMVLPPIVQDATIWRDRVMNVSILWEQVQSRSDPLKSQTGAVPFIQRFDSVLKLNLHFHMLCLDGVYLTGEGSCVLSDCF